MEGAYKSRARTETGNKGNRKRGTASSEHGTGSRSQDQIQEQVEEQVPTSVRDMVHRNNTKAVNVSQGQDYMSSSSPCQVQPDFLDVRHLLVATGTAPFNSRNNSVTSS